MDPSKDFFIPDHWPLPTDQKGPCCGLYGWANAVNYGFAESKDVPFLYARKEGNKRRKVEKTKNVSVRFAAKDLNCTSFGEIFDKESFAKLANYFGINNCKVVTTDEKITQEAYINKICKRLKKGNTLIAACDRKEGSDFPGDSKGAGAHWATIFGYYYSKEKCYFLVTQHGRYYIWDAEKLYQSNFTLPDDIFKDARQVYYKVKRAEGGKTEYYVKSHDVPLNVKSRKPIFDSIKNFRICNTKQLKCYF